jgi:hypothetical protein
LITAAASSAEVGHSRGNFNAAPRGGEQEPDHEQGGISWAGRDGFAHGDEPAEGRSRANRLELNTLFPVRLLEKDLGYTVQTGGGEALMPTASAVRSTFRRAIDENLGNLNMTAVVKLFSSDPSGCGCAQ